MKTWKNYVALGDSVTEGVGDPVEGLEPWSAVDRTAIYLRQRNPALRYANLARRGLKSGEILEQQLPIAQALNPDFVNLIAGGNDVLKGEWDPEQFRQAMRTMLDALAKPGVTVLLATIPDFPLLKKLPPEAGARIRGDLLECNEIIRDLSARYGTLLVESWHYPPSLEARFWSEDLIHPNARGYLEFSRLSVAQVASLEPSLASAAA